MKIQRIALVVPAVLLIAGCGGTAASPHAANDSGTSTEMPIGRSDESFQYGEDAATAPESAPGAPDVLVDQAKDADGVETQTPSVISRGQVSVETEDVDKARFEVQKLVDGWNGTIASEQSDADDEGRTQRQRWELRVPGNRFDAAMDELSGLGNLIKRSRTSEDVTTQVIDTRARVRSQRLSLARIQALLARAKNINEIIAIEAQLSQRQADLDSLEQQQAYLADQTSLATINLYLSVPEEKTTESQDDDGFLTGLKDGWKNLGSATESVLNTVGVVLPFGGVLLLIGIPVWLSRRRRTRTS